MDSYHDLIEANLGVVRATIAAACRRAGRSPQDVLLVAVTKTVAPERIRAACACGLAVLGENRVQEAQDKIGALSDLAVDWHMIGHLQGNKAGQAVRLFQCVQSVDSVELAERLSQRATAAGRRLPVLLEVNVGGEDSKFGLRLAPVADHASVYGALLAAAQCICALPGLDVQGLMTVAPLVADPELARPIFRRLRELRDGLQAALPAVDWQHLSMGMTDDYAVAIEEGATIVRLGRAIFGPRQPRT